MLSDQTKKCIHTKKGSLVSLISIILLLLGQLVAHSSVLAPTIVTPSNDFEFTNENLLESITSSTNALSDLYNERAGIFLWNIQNLDNLSRYGNLGESTNIEDMLETTNYELWFEGLAQDIAMQYLLLKDYVQTSFKFTGSLSEEFSFNKEWIQRTNTIATWLYDIATDDQLIFLLDALSDDGDGFSSYWDALIRPQSNSFAEETFSLLCDTLVLCSKILQAVKFMPYFTPREVSVYTLKSELISNWWSAINHYALFDPSFAVAAIGKSLLYENNTGWISWQCFTQMAKNGTFTFANVSTSAYTDFQTYLYTSPEIADQYVSYIEKASVESSYAWNPTGNYYQLITNEAYLSCIDEIISNYADHIVVVRDKVQYVYDPKYDSSWIPLEKTFSGYSYRWDKYLIDQQGASTDLYQYRYDGPLKKSGCRTYQGAGDIRGLLDIYQLLSHAFRSDLVLQKSEKAAFSIVQQILLSERDDGSYILSPYFGTSLPDSIVKAPLFNDAKIYHPMVLPEGLNTFTGTMHLVSFFQQAAVDLEQFGVDYLSFLVDKIDGQLEKMADLLLSKVDKRTFGMALQSISGDLDGTTPQLYSPANISLTIDFKSSGISLNDLPLWVGEFDFMSATARTTAYQWNYLQLLFNMFELYNESRYIEPILEALVLFNTDFSVDNEYQVLSVCGTKDAVAKTFFAIQIGLNSSMVLSDTTGKFASAIPYNYRENVIPVTHAFASEIPHQLSSMLLSILPNLPEPLLPILQDPFVQFILLGFVTGIIMTLAVIFIKRPRNH